MAPSNFIKQILGFRITSHPVNRGALVVLPKAPFIDRVAGLNGDAAEAIEARVAQERTAYLLPIFSEILPDPEVIKMMSSDLRLGCAR